MNIEKRRVSLCNLPTPLAEMPVLSAKLGGPRILIKRDDLSGLAMGGQKCRMFEYIMSEAKDMGADAVITAGTPQGNQGPQLAAAACKLGMDFIIFICKGDNRVQGNLLLLNLLGVEIKPIDIEISEEAKLYSEMESLATKLRSKGRRPYVFHISGPKAPLTIIGYANTVSEICKQLQERGLTAQRLFSASTTGMTQAGLSLGVKYFSAPFKIFGVMYGLLTREEQVQNITDLANVAAKFLGTSFTFTSDEVILYDQYIGKYRMPIKKSIEAVKLVARTEGLFLDPLYTGRAMAALIDQVREGKIKQEETIIFYHSGGLAAIFAHNEDFI